MMSQAVAAWAVLGGGGRGPYSVWEASEERLVILSLLLVGPD
jgi:hypothetical protein